MRKLALGSKVSVNAKEIWEANVLSQKLGINTFEGIIALPFLLALSLEAGILTRKEIEEDMRLPAPKWLGGHSNKSRILDGTVSQNN
jgi:hypothetical protein